MRRARGLSIVEVVVAFSLLAVALLGTLSLELAAQRLREQTKDSEIARRAMEHAREALAAQPIRHTTAALPLSGANLNDVWIFSVNSPCEIARNEDGSSFKMPNCNATINGGTGPFTTGNTRTCTGPRLLGFSPATKPTNPYRATVNGIGDCLVVEFPVPPLKPANAALQSFPGRAIFYVNEATQPATVVAATPSTWAPASFPFPPTPGLAFLDLDGNGLKDSVDVRTKGNAATTPTKLIPVQIRVDWATRSGNESVSTFFLLSYRGF